jgi:hypothetical protein
LISGQVFSGWDLLEKDSPRVRLNCFRAQHSAAIAANREQQGQAPSSASIGYSQRGQLVIVSPFEVSA